MANDYRLFTDEERKKYDEHYRELTLKFETYEEREAFHAGYSEALKWAARVNERAAEMRIKGGD